MIRIVPPPQPKLSHLPFRQHRRQLPLHQPSNQWVSIQPASQPPVSTPQHIPVLSQHLASVVCSTMMVWLLLHLTSVAFPGAEPTKSYSQPAFESSKSTPRQFSALSSFAKSKILNYAYCLLYSSIYSFFVVLFFIYEGLLSIKIRQMFCLCLVPVTARLCHQHHHRHHPTSMWNRRRKTME